MHPPRTFETTRLMLRPVEEADAVRIFKTYAESVSATRFMNFPRHQHLAESEQFAKRCVDCWAAESAFPWAVFQKDDQAFIGVIELRLAPPKADFGYIYGEAFWRKGYGAEAAHAVVEWAIAQPTIFRVWATCHPDNAGSARVLLRAGLRFEGRLANWEARPQLGEVAGDSDCYVLTKSGT